MGGCRGDSRGRPGIAARGAAALARAALALLALAAAPAAAAQSYFGQNQVRYDQFDWQVLETEHFLVHYYPAARTAALDAARMAERAYARLSRILDHQFREKKPIVLFASRTDFAQNNVTGDLGEATGGVTESLRHRILLYFTGDYRSFERVLTHEMVHAFQYDVFARGRAGAGLQTLAQANMPLWFTEGMAEYLSIGPASTLTDLWMRDAALHGRIPTTRQMGERPDRYFPYRFGHAFWTYIGQRYGDESVGQILAAVPGAGVERAFRRELGADLDELSVEWRETMQMTHLAPVASLERARRFAQPLLTERQTGGDVFLAPALSSDGRHVAYLANGKFNRGEVFIDLWLGDGRTGERIGRLAKSTTGEFEELRFLYSQSAFSPDGSLLAFTAQQRGRDVLVILDVARRRVRRRLELPVETAMGPSFSPDGRRIVFSGTRGGISDLFIVGVDGRNFRQLTDDRYGDIQPVWSPDGRTIAFATDRGDDSDLAVLDLGPMRIATLDVATGAITVLPGQRGMSINPQWSPDAATIAYVTDRSGIPNVFLYDLAAQEHYQLTNVLGGVAGMTDLSPAITWAHKADRLAFTHFDDGRYTVWSIANPRALRRTPYRGTMIAQASVEPAAGFRDTLAPGDSAYRPPVSVAQLLDSATLALPDSGDIRDGTYRPRLHPDYVARPSIGYAPDSYGRNVFGGTTVVLSDLLGDQRVGVAAELNGRAEEARLFAGYSMLAGRWQYSAGLSQAPFYFLSSDRITESEGRRFEEQEITTYIVRQGFAAASYPFSRFTRLELGIGLNAIGVRRSVVQRDVTNGHRGRFELLGRSHGAGLDYLDAQLAWVSDNTLAGYTAPAAGRRYRLEVNPVIGSLRWVEYLADYRRYDPIVFGKLTFATRLYANVSIGPDESAFPKYIARPDFVRGYDRTSQFFASGCQISAPARSNCSAVQLLGSRVAVANAELRFPILGAIPLGFAPIAIPPVEAAAFFDAGLAWTAGQRLYSGRPVGYDATRQRFPLKSYGVGLRVNFFNYAVLRWDYAVPMDQPGGKGFWTWSLWPSF